MMKIHLFYKENDKIFRVEGERKKSRNIAKILMRPKKNCLI
jgi:hypothetical protein